MKTDETTDQAKANEPGGSVIDATEAATTVERLPVSSTKSGSMVELYPEDPRIVLVGLTHVDLYGGPDADPPHALFDERVFWPAARRKHLHATYALERFRKAEPALLTSEGKGSKQLFLVVNGRQRILGAREYNASLPAGEPRMKVWVIFEEYATPAEMFAAMFVANLGATKDDIVTTAHKVFRAKKYHKLTTKEVTRRFGFSAQKQARLLQLLELHTDVQEAVRSGELKLHTALTLVGLPKPMQVVELEKAREAQRAAQPPSTETLLPDGGRPPLALEAGGQAADPLPGQPKAPEPAHAAPGATTAAGSTRPTSAPGEAPKAGAAGKGKAAPAKAPRLTAKSVKASLAKSSGVQTFDPPTPRQWGKMADAIERSEGPKLADSIKLFVMVVAGRADLDSIPGLAALHRTAMEGPAKPAAPAVEKRVYEPRGKSGQGKKAKPAKAARPAKKPSASKKSTRKGR